MPCWGKDAILGLQMNFEIQFKVGLLMGGGMIRMNWHQDDDTIMMCQHNKRSRVQSVFESALDWSCQLESWVTWQTFNALMERFWGKIHLLATLTFPDGSALVWWNRADGGSEVTWSGQLQSEVRPTQVSSADVVVLNVFQTPRLLLFFATVSKTIAYFLR